MNPNDYDEDGNNIVPCPICMSNFNPCKDGGKCPDEDEFVRSVEAKQFIESQQELARSKYVCYSPDVGHYRNGGGKLTR